MVAQELVFEQHLRRSSRAPSTQALHLAVAFAHQHTERATLTTSRTVLRTRLALKIPGIPRPFSSSSIITNVFQHFLCLLCLVVWGMTMATSVIFRL